MEGEAAVVEREKEEGSMEAEFERSGGVPTWKEQITVRAMATSLVLNVVFNFIVCKLSLTTGVIPSLNVAAGLLGFAIIKSYAVVLDKLGLLKQPFTRQENTVIQTCVVACAGIAFSSGTGSYILGMTPLVASQADAGNTPLNVKKLTLGWMICFNLLVSFVGLFSITFLRNTMILGYKLTYPSGTATATLINSFHTSKGGKLAKKQVMKLFNYSIFSFCWAFFQWFFTAGDDCGFVSFPTFGLQAYTRKFYFDFSATYVGVGMICPYMVNVSLLLGAFISWFIMWPFIEAKKGSWYSADLPGSSLHGLQGYKVFIAVAVMLGDGIFHVVYMLVKTILSLQKQHKSKEGDDKKATSYDEQKRNEHFTQDQIPLWLALSGYVACAALSVVCVPLIFPQLRFYHLIAIYAVAPVFAFCNAYGCGLSDWSLASNYGKIAIFVFSAWVGPDHGGVVAGLVSCGVMMNIVSTASDLMQDFKTGYLTLSSPRAMLLAQLAGTLMGCVVSPAVFWLFYKAYSLGDPAGSYPAPYGLMYRGIALLGSEGLASLPDHCLELALGFFLASLLLCAAREAIKSRGCGWYKALPSPMCMAIPFYLGGYFAIDMVVGSAVVWLWELRDKKSAHSYRAAVASGLICGDSLWGIPAAVLALAGASPPICMRFFSSSVNQKVSSFLGS